MSVRFSVLMPTHNRVDVIGFAIGSVLAQTDGDFELLIVGDGCTDDTAQVVAGFADERVRWFDLPKAPHFGYANRNSVLRQARGEFVAFAAHDDLLFPDHLATLARRMQDTGAEWVYSRPLWVSPSGIVMPLSGNLENADELHIFLSGRNFIPASCVLHRRSCLEKYGYWSEHISRGGDFELWCRFIEGGGRRKFAYESTPTTLHFKAVWKHRVDQDVPAVGNLLGVANAAAWWPAALRVAGGEGVSQQSVFAALCRSPWIADVRAAVTTVVERLAWDYAKRGIREGENLRAEMSMLDSVLAQRDAVIASLAAQIGALGDQALKATNDWPSSPPPPFDEQQYLALNPDVAEAVSEGRLRSGFEHWLIQGRREGRLVRMSDEPE